MDIIIGGLLAAGFVAASAVALRLAVWLHRARVVIGWLAGQVDDLTGQVEQLTAAAQQPSPRWAHLDGEALPQNGWVKRWLRPGDEMLNGGTVPDGQFGVQLLGDIEIWDAPEELARLGDALAARFMSPRVSIVSELADVLGAIDPGANLGFRVFTCIEANRLAEMFAQFGHLDAARTVIAGHALEDNGDDEHAYIREVDERDGDEARDEAAEVYVRRLMGHEAQPVEADAKLAELEDLRVQAGKAGDDVDDDVRDRIVQLERELGCEPAYV